MGKIVQKREQIILVECSVGYKYPDNPQAVIIDNRRYKIKKIISRMRTPEKEIFQVKLDNGKEYKVSYTAVSDKWVLES